MRALLCQCCSNAMERQLPKESTLSNHFQTELLPRPERGFLKPKSPAENAFATERMLPQRMWQMRLPWLWQPFPLIIPPSQELFDAPRSLPQLRGPEYALRPELIALPKVMVRPQAALSPGLQQTPPAARWPGAAQFSEEQAVTRSTGFQAR